MPASACKHNAVDESPATNTVTNHLAPDSAAHTFATAGTFYWQAVYSGDTLHATYTDPRDLHSFPTRRSSDLTTLSDDASPTPNTAAGGSTLTVPVGTSVHDTAVKIGRAHVCTPVTQ